MLLVQEKVLIYICAQCTQIQRPWNDECFLLLLFGTPLLFIQPLNNKKLSIFHSLQTQIKPFSLHA